MLFFNALKNRSAKKMPIYLTRLALIFIQALIIQSCFATQEAEKSPAPSKTNIIMIVGDSLSTAYGIPQQQGWVQLMEKKLSLAQPGWKVVNLSISGQTSGGARKQFDAQLKEFQPKVVIIGLGGNDGLRGIPTNNIKENLELMIKSSKAINAKVILLGMELPPNYGPVYADAFKNLYQDLKENHQIIWTPSFLRPLTLKPGLFQKDGIHPTAEAQPLLLDPVWTLIKDAIHHGAAQ